MVVFDASFLIFFLDPKLKSGAGNNPRVDHLVATINTSGDRIIVPTPALSEVLVGAKDAAPNYLDIINRSKFFRVEPFGLRAAVEVAAMMRDAISTGNKRGSAPPETTWAKVNFDRQIVAIARVCGATTIYSQDGDVARLVKEFGIEVLTVEQLPEPPTSQQLLFEMSALEAEVSQEEDDDDDEGP